jgi:hypothetical protein
MKRAEQTVWVVMHYEIMGVPDSPHIDSVQFHVSSSLTQAEQYIHGAHVAAYSWWQVHPHVVDASDGDEGTDVCIYSHRGTRLRVPPTVRAITAFRKHVARHPEWYPGVQE